MCALKIDVSSPEMFAESTAAVRQSLTAEMAALFDCALTDLPRLSLEYYVYTANGKSGSTAQQQAATIKEVLSLLAAGDEEIIFNTRQNFFDGKSARRIVAAYWAIIKEIDYVKHHTAPDLNIAYDYAGFNALLEKLPWYTHLALVLTVALKRK